jgi:thiamine transporter 2/3
MSYQTLMTVASFEIVKDLPSDAYGLVFGLNVFLALGLQTALTFVVNDTLEVEPRPQFVIYSAYFLVATLLFLPVLVGNVYKRRQNRLKKFTEVHQLGRSD